MAGSGTRSSPGGTTQNNKASLANVPSLAEVWKEELERCKELAVSTQPNTVSHIHRDTFPDINPPALTQIWHDHVQVLREVGASSTRADTTGGFREIAQTGTRQDAIEDLLGWFQQQADLPASPSHPHPGEEGLHGRSQESDDVLTQPERHLVNFSQDEVSFCCISYNQPCVEFSQFWVT